MKLVYFANLVRPGISTTDQVLPGAVNATLVSAVYPISDSVFECNTEMVADGIKYRVPEKITAVIALLSTA